MDPKARDELYARVEASRIASLSSQEVTDTITPKDSDDDDIVQPLRRDILGDAATTKAPTEEISVGGIHNTHDDASVITDMESVLYEMQNSLYPRPADFNASNGSQELADVILNVSLANGKETTRKEPPKDNEAALPSSQQSDLQSGPGAYAIQTVLPFANGPTSNGRPNAEERRMADNNHDHGLVVARPATADEELAHAEPVVDKAPKVVASERSAETKGRQRQGRCLLLLWLLGVVVVVLILVFLMPKSGAPTAASPNTPEEPSTAPSVAPTSPAEDDPLGPFLASLPNHTIQSLQDPFSPQSQALVWLSNHQNLTNLAIWRQTQLFALATFYYSMGGPAWPVAHQRSWMDDTVEECNWFSSHQGVFVGEDGVFQEGEDVGAVFEGFSYTAWDHELCHPPSTGDDLAGRVKDLTLDSLGLANQSATVPPELALLTSLEVFFLLGSNVGGRLEDFLPSQFYSMPSLREIDLFGNSFTGFMPTSFGQMMFLKGLDLSINYLSGSIPTEVGALTSLQSMALYDNLLSGTMPSEISQMTDLVVFQVFKNRLDGSVPTAVEKLTNLTDLWLYSNALSGTLPPGIGRLTDLTTLDVDTNAMTGNLPTQLGFLTSLTSLWLSANAFDGPIPTEIGSLSNVHTLSLHGNQVSGSLPSEIGLMGNLMRLWIQDLPLLAQSIPRELAAIANLTILNLNNTGLSGVVPGELCRLQDNNCSTYFAASGWNTDIPCQLRFGCSDTLCGCDCDCTNQKNLSKPVANSS